MTHTFLVPTTAALLTLACGRWAEPLPLAPPPQMPSTPPTIQTAAPAVTASNTFGLSLYQRLAKEAPDKNVFISPYSISVALTMAAEGARDQTEREMSATLGFPIVQGGGRTITPVNEGYLALSQRFNEAKGNADPAVRQRLEDLARDLAAANADSVRLEKEEKWSEAGAAERKASSIATELNTLRSRVDRFDLRVANALWVEQTFSLVPAYVQTIDRFYGSGGVTPVDFAHNPDGSRQRINAWVEDHTEDRIKDLLLSGSIASDTRLVIANAVYFKGEWADPFHPSSTKEEAFHPASGADTKAMMMHAWRGAPYAAFTGRGDFFTTPQRVPVDAAKRPATYPDDDGFTMMEIPYKGNELSMVLLLPRSTGGLPALESRLSAQNLASWLGHFENRTVETALPRFKVGYEQELSGHLGQMGMKRAFVSPGAAEGAQFGGMSSSEDPSQQLYIGLVVHKAWIETNEKGTEAAAATAVTMRAGAAVRREETVPFNPVFCADHPFLFLVRDTKTGLVLFIGRVAAPTPAG